MVCKSFLVFDLSFKLEIDSAFIEKVSKVKKTLGDFENLIGGKTLARALAGVVDQGILEVKNVSGVRRTLKEAFESWIWGGVVTNIVADIVDWGVLIGEKISRVKKILKGTFES